MNPAVHFPTTAPVPALFDLAPRAPGGLPIPTPAASVRELLETFLTRRSPRTRRAYGKDLDDFAGFLEVDSREGAIRSLLEGGAAQGNALALRYKAALLERGLRPATVNRRLSALRSVVALARLVGLSSFRLEVQGERAEPYRDTRGPNVAGVERILAAVEGDDLRARRDRALLRLLWDWALRRGEVAALDVGDFDREGRRLAVLGKGKADREWIELPEPTALALEAYLALRPGAAPAEPLFVSLDRAHAPGRMSGTALYKLVGRYARRAGISGRVSPHRLRHAAITAALDRTGGDVRAVRSFSRHAKVETVLRYDDRRRDGGGKVAALVASAI